MTKTDSLVYRIWNTVELVVEGEPDGKDPLASRFGRFRVSESGTPDLSISKKSKLDLDTRILLPENRGFITPRGLGWLSGSKRGIYLEWPPNSLAEWRLQVALDEVKFPQFRHFLDLKAIGKGVAAIHGSAVLWKGESVIVAGPPGVGKTSLMAGLIKDGGELVGDDWLWIRSLDNRPTVLGMDETVELSPEMVDLLINRKKISRDAKKEYWAARLLKKLASIFAAFSRPVSPFLAQKVENFAFRRKITLPVEHFRNPERPQSSISPSSISHCFLIVQSDDDQISLKPVEVSDMARRLSTLNRIERSWMYQVCCYAELSFSECKIELNAYEEAERDLFQSLLRDVDCYLISYPENTDPLRLLKLVGHLLEENVQDQREESRAHHG